MRSALPLALFLLLAGGCASVPKANIGQADYKLEDDERRMMKRSDEACETLDDSGQIYQDRQLEEYLNRVALSLLPAEAAAAGVKIRVSVLNDPNLNAFSLPNGRIYVHTGILAAIENEAQLAALLGHEMTHVLHRHALREFRSLINKSAFLYSLMTPIAVAGGGDLGIVFTQLAVVSSVYGYSQQMEYEADEGGFQVTAQKGYDVNEAPKLFEHLDQFIEDEEIKEPFFFSTHPSVRARIKNFKELAAARNPTGGTVEAATYQAMTKKLLIDNFQLCLQGGLFRTAEHNNQEYRKLYPQEAQGYYLQGELFRQRQDHSKKEKKREKSGDYPEALKDYERAIELDAGFAPAYQGKARILQKEGKPGEAKESYRKYLELAPQAKDRSYVEQFIQSP